MRSEIARGTYCSMNASRSSFQLPGVTSGKLYHQAAALLPGLSCLWNICGLIWMTTAASSNHISNSLNHSFAGIPSSPLKGDGFSSFIARRRCSRSSSRRSLSSCARFARSRATISSHSLPKSSSSLSNTSWRTGLRCPSRLLSSRRRSSRRSLSRSPPRRPSPPAPSRRPPLFPPPGPRPPLLPRPLSRSPGFLCGQSGSPLPPAVAYAAAARVRWLVWWTCWLDAATLGGASKCCTAVKGTCWSPDPFASADVRCKIRRGGWRSSLGALCGWFC
mmetsp:Transcript_44800/g.126520  ORF Transcript_44800/g.126520 Transcript_44800/m.126520 type:complete len:276 (+) Transcript_44800:435-1262(+)